MATPSSAAQVSTTPTFKSFFERRLKPFLTPYYLVVAAVLGAITTVFGIVTLVLIMIVANFNVLSLIE